MPRRSSLFALAVLLAACGGKETVVEHPDDREPDAAHGAGDADQAPASRALGITATFGDLVALARGLDDRSEGDAAAGCLLGGAGPYRLEADLAVALHPLPEAPADLDERLETTRSVRVLSRWGQLGAEGDLAAVVFTTTPPPTTGSAVAWIVTDRGLSIRPIGPSGAREGPLSLAHAAERAAALGGAGLVVVASEAGVALSDLRTVLAALASARAAVALAVTLAPDVRLPSPSPVADDGVGLCPNGLPDVPDTELGQLSAQAIVSALGPLRDGATACLESAQGRAAAGGRVVLAMRIGPDGAMANACLVEDPIRDPRLRSCLLEAARATAFTPPSPAGVVDAVLPLELRPDASATQRPTCE